MPYDARLDNRRLGFSGTHSDFPQRALHHFAHQIVNGNLHESARAHRELVEQSLKKFKPPVRSRGQTASDKDVTAVIRRLWSKHKGRRGAILRELRDKSGVACEQSRFRRLADRYEESRNDAE